MTASATSHSYPNPNSVVIKQLNLARHPEGGYFAETDRQSEHVASPFADQALRPLATSIFYLLTPDEPNGYLHMNKSATMHVLHQGRAEYTLITPGRPPKIEKKVIGTNVQAGELLQLLVPTGVWKMSRLLQEDLDAASDEFAKDRCGCLITEVVFPGFVWGDHAFLTLEEFNTFWDDSDAPEAKELVRYVRKV
ncbi:RmlC-like cupin domain-containing protein [Fomes fomentarius]|nr:RmlC-like cupin domain-containing protein [Fomes fomentarius]